MRRSNPASLRGCGKANVKLVVQTINAYQEALLVGQKAFDAQDHVSKPLPHIFGSAAYLQDPHAGLGSTATQQGIEASTQSQQSRVSDEQMPARLVPLLAAARPEPSTADTGAGSKAEPIYHPRNFKAMLEAALNGDVSVTSQEQQQSADEEHEAISWQKDPDASPGKGVTRKNESMLSTSNQPDDSKSVSQVLAWLEQGRDLFDEESDEIEH